MHSFIYSLVILSLFGVLSSNKISADNDTFYYFAYGSNLLAKRLHIHVPSAQFYSTAKLDDYILDFNMYDNMSWCGAVATIVETPSEVVWGNVWLIPNDQMKYLDEQEGVGEKWYFAKNVTVTTPDGEQIVARTYQEVNNPSTSNLSKDLPPERRPSNSYLAVIILGAIESHLPSDYIGFLISFPTNKKMAETKIRQELGYPFY